jgi:DNA-binding transcriptional regulator GbsR (MarR family)
MEKLAELENSALQKHTTLQQQLNKGISKLEGIKKQMKNIKTLTAETIAKLSQEEITILLEVNQLKKQIHHLSICMIRYKLTVI